MKFMKKCLPVCILILIDQLIKIIIFKNLMGKEINLLGNFLGFKPYLNDKYSWINSLTDMGIGLVIHIAVVAVLLLFIFIIYDFIRRRYSINTYAYIMFMVLFAGSLCSLIDKVAWGGSLDYIWLKGFFIFDLKDVYVSIFEGMVIILFIFNKEFRDMKMKVVAKEFILYFNKKFLRKS